LRNRASRVARPRTSGSTPLAAGSSVPVWPMRGSPSTRRRHATTSCDVGPAGLSMTSKPSMELRNQIVITKPRRSRRVHEGFLVQKRIVSLRVLRAFVMNSRLEDFGTRGALDGVLDLLDEELPERVDAARDRAAGGILVTAAAE